MDSKIFKKLFEDHPEKLSESWLKLTDNDLATISGNLNLFLKKVSQLYQVPEDVVLKELDAVQKNIEEGIDADYSPRLDPRE